MIAVTLRSPKRQSTITANSEAELQRKLKNWEKAQTRELERHVEKELDRLVWRFGR